MPERVDFAVITALRVERQAVVSRLDEPGEGSGVGKVRVSVLFSTKTDLTPINVLNVLSSFVDVDNAPVCDLYST